MLNLLSGQCNCIILSGSVGLFIADTNALSVHPYCINSWQFANNEIQAFPTILPMSQMIMEKIIDNRMYGFLVTRKKESSEHPGLNTTFISCLLFKKRK